MIFLAGLATSPRQHQHSFVHDVRRPEPRVDDQRLEVSVFLRHSEEAMDVLREAERLSSRGKAVTVGAFQLKTFDGSRSFSDSGSDNQ